MDNKFGGFVVVFIVALWAVAMGAVFAGEKIARKAFESQAIERGYALHCPADGEFAWKGECEEGE